jgi:hypothetical protein
MRRSYHRFVILTIVFSLAGPMLTMQKVTAQIIDKSILEKLEKADRSEFRYLPKIPGRYTAEDWRAVIDSTWGQGMPTSKKLQLFDHCWNLIDHTYPSFFHIHDNWDSLKNVYRPEVAAGVSRGRFCAIMNYMFSRLTDMHSAVTDVPVSQDSLKPGVPLFAASGKNSIYAKIYVKKDFCHFGASLAPLPDSSVFVYDVIADHPLNLEPGDIVIGYDNIPWKELYKKILTAELPIIGSGTFGSNSESIEYELLVAAGENWHLFDVIDIVKYSSGDTLHLPTSLLAGQKMQLLTTDQLPVPGVPFPDIDNGHLVSWGIVEGTQTGYIYVWGWTLADQVPPPSYNCGDEFLQALQSLINDYQIDGLIIDSRFNMGGYTFQYLKCLSVLFNEDQDSFFEYVRNDPNDHYSMKREYNNHFQVDATPYLFDRPIAMLTGPASVSCGDLMPMQMRLHPMVRTFGLGTNGVFGKVQDHDISAISNDLILHTTYSNLTMAGQPDQFMTHMSYPPDEEIWLTQEAAVIGEDPVVKRALAWITNLTHAHDATIDKLFTQPASDSVFLSAEVENPNQHAVQVTAMITNSNDQVTDSLDLHDDGLEGDSLAGDDVWGGKWAAPADKSYFTVDITTKDPVDSTERTLPKILHFTTIGPVQLFDKYHAYLDGNYYESRHRQSIALILSNKDSEAMAKNIKSVISTEDPRVYKITTNTASFGDIAAGSADSSGVYFFQYDTASGPESTIGNPIKFKVGIYSNNILYWTDEMDYVTGLEELADLSLPLNFSLSQNYPNPFNPSTIISWNLAVASQVDLSVYNILGQKVATLVSGKQPAGSYKIEWDATELATGVYLYRLFTDQGFVQTRKLVLIK